MWTSFEHSNCPLLGLYYSTDKCRSEDKEGMLLASALLLESGVLLTFLVLKSYTVKNLNLLEVELKLLSVQTKCDMFKSWLLITEQTTNLNTNPNFNILSTSKIKLLDNLYFFIVCCVLWKNKSLNLNLKGSGFDSSQCPAQGKLIQGKAQQALKNWKNLFGDQRETA